MTECVGLLTGRGVMGFVVRVLLWSVSRREGAGFRGLRVGAGWVEWNCGSGRVGMGDEWVGARSPPAQPRSPQGPSRRAARRPRHPRAPPLPPPPPLLLPARRLLLLLTRGWRLERRRLGEPGLGRRSGSTAHRSSQQPPDPGGSGATRSSTRPRRRSGRAAAGSSLSPRPHAAE